MDSYMKPYMKTIVPFLGIVDIKYVSVPSFGDGYETDRTFDDRAQIDREDGGDP